MATPLPQNRAAFTAAEIALATAGALVRGAAGTTSVGVCTDTRTVARNNLFVALRGETVDGHRFVNAAIAAGASVIMVERDADLSTLAGALSGAASSVVVVDDTLRALGRLARAHRDRWERRHAGACAVVAITGSAGKTTTKELCAAALIGSLGEEAVLVTRGNLNNRIGVPMTLFGLEERHSVAVIEAGISVRGEMHELAEIIWPDVVLLTNVGVAHAEGLADPLAGPQQSVVREKGALIAAAGTFAIACGDDAWASGSLVLAQEGAATLDYGRLATASYRLVDVAAHDDGTTRVTIERPDSPSQPTDRERLVVSLPLLGEAAAENLTGALAAADCAMEILGAAPIERAMLDSALSRRVRPVPGRLSPRKRSDGALILDDSYNANPQAFAASIATARQIATSSKRRLLVVAGEMRELGQLAADEHEAIGELIAQATPALLVTCGGEAERMALAADRAGIPVRRGTDATSAAALIAHLVGPNDVVLVKGSRGVGTEVVVEAILARGGEIKDGAEAQPFQADHGAPGARGV